MSSYLSLQVLTTLLRLGLGSASRPVLNRPGSDTDRAQPQAAPPPFSPPLLQGLSPFSPPHSPLLSPVPFHLHSLSAILLLLFSFAFFLPLILLSSLLNLFSFLLCLPLSIPISSPSPSPLPPFPPPLFSLLSSCRLFSTRTALKPSNLVAYKLRLLIPCQVCTWV